MAKFKRNIINLGVQVNHFHESGITAKRENPGRAAATPAQGHDPGNYCAAKGRGTGDLSQPVCVLDKFPAPLQPPNMGIERPLPLRATALHLANVNAHIVDDNALNAESPGVFDLDQTVDGGLADPWKAPAVQVGRG